MNDMLRLVPRMSISNNELCQHNIRLALATATSELDACALPFLQVGFSGNQSHVLRNRHDTNTTQLILNNTYTLTNTNIHTPNIANANTSN